ncbi:MAG: hypothetical protein E7164_02615 [Firmicutes bacterium]|nr:hypothetical protein [Bacillota bacterium]
MNEELSKYLPKEDSWLVLRENGLLLSDYHVEVLLRNGINYQNYTSIKEILFAINDILDEDYDEELDLIAKQIDERNYYNSKKN